jgi:transposase-like protein
LGEFVSFLEYPVELRKIVYTTNAIESLNAWFRKASDTAPISRCLFFGPCRRSCRC